MKLYSKLHEAIAKPVSAESALDQCVRTYASPIAFARKSGRSLRILFLAPRDDYGNPARGLGIEENYFFHTLYEMGHELIRFDSLGILRKQGRRKMNEMIIEAVYRSSPDLVFSVLFKDEIDRSTIETLSNQTVTINWFCDDHWRFESFSRDWASSFTWVITTAKSALPKYAQAGLDNVILSQWACNTKLYYRMDLPQLYDITFIGLPHGNRPKIIARLKQAGLNVMNWGYGWGGGRVSQFEMVRIFNQSRINLNLSNSSMLNRQQIKGRNFEIPGCGGFLLTDRAENLEAYYEIGKEIVCFETCDELIDKVKYFLKNETERDCIAQAGYQRTLREHTFESRFTEIFSKIGLG